MRHFLIILAFIVAFLVLSLLLRKLNERLISKYNFSLARYAAWVVYIGSAVIVVIAVVSILQRPADLHTPLGKLAALHWRAGDATQPDCRLCPDGLFIIICDADRGHHISSLRELSALQADYRKNRIPGEDLNIDRYSCISNQSFLLKRHSGTYGFSYDPESDVPLRQDVSFQVIKESDAEQIVEVHYRDSMKDIIDSLFRYEIRKDKIKALESSVLLKAQVGLFLKIAFLALLILLYGGVRAVLRRYTSRRCKRMDEKYTT